MTPLQRVVVVGFVLAASSLSSCANVGAAGAPATEAPLLVATWPFGKQATDKALETIKAGGSALDGIEQGIMPLLRYCGILCCKQIRWRNWAP